MSDKKETTVRIKINKLLEATALPVPPTIDRQHEDKALNEVERFRKSCKTGKVDIEALINKDRH